jgi:amino acid permease
MERKLVVLFYLFSSRFFEKSPKGEQEITAYLELFCFLIFCFFFFLFLSRFSKKNEKKKKQNKTRRRKTKLETKIQKEPLKYLNLNDVFYLY